MSNFVNLSLLPLGIRARRKVEDCFAQVRLQNGRHKSSKSQEFKGLVLSVAHDV